MIWCILLNSRINSVRNIQKQRPHGLGRCNAMESMTCAYWKKFLLKAYQTRSATVCGLIGARRRALQCPIWLATPLQWRHNNKVVTVQTGRVTTKSQTVGEEIRYTKAATIIASEQVGPRLSHPFHAISPVHQTLILQCQYGIHTCHASQIRILDHLQWQKSTIHLFADSVLHGIILPINDPRNITNVRQAH